MIRTHLLTWICGRPVWTWKWLTLTEWSRLSHYTGAMIKLKAAKLAIIGCVGITAGALPPAVWYGPGIVRGLIGGGPSEAFGPARYQAHAVPEPGALGILILGIGGLWWARRR